MIKIPEAVFEEGRMDKEFHARLILDLARFSEVAGIVPDMVWSALSDYCSPEEVEWVRRMKQDKTNGLVYTGTLEVPVEDKMMAIAGACLRNYIDARVMPVQDVITKLKADTMPTPSVLLIPNFCIDKGSGGDIAQWHISSLLGLLYARLAKNLKTVVYVGSWSALEKNYGDAFKKHLDAHYHTI